MRETDWIVVLALAVIALAAVGIFLAIMLSVTMSRVDDLETRVNIFETVRIEYIAPDGDGA